MDPNDQPPAGPDAPDKETMEQVRRLVLSSQSPVTRLMLCLCERSRRCRSGHDAWPSWASPQRRSRRRANPPRLPAQHHHQLPRQARRTRPRSTSHPRRPRRLPTHSSSLPSGRAGRPRPRALQVLPFVLLARGPPLKLTTSFQRRRPRASLRPHRSSRTRTMPTECSARSSASRPTPTG